MKILVVDDEKLLVKGITFNLQNEGYEVGLRSCHSGLDDARKIRQRGVHGDPHLFRRAGHHAHRQK